MIVPAAIAKLNQYTDPHFQSVMDQITAAQEEGLSEFDLDVQLLDEGEIRDIVIALEFVGYLAHFNNESFTIDVIYE